MDNKKIKSITYGRNEKIEREYMLYNTFFENAS